MSALRLTPMKKGATWLRIKAALLGRPKFDHEDPVETPYLDEGWLAARAGYGMWQHNKYPAQSQEARFWRIGWRQYKGANRKR